MIVRAIKHGWFLLRKLIRNSSPSLVFYKDIYRRRVLFFKPFSCDQESNFEIHMLVCKKDVLNALWALTTFFYWSGLRPVVVIHDDGSLRQKDQQLFKTYFKGSKVVEKDKANKKVNTFLSEHPYSQKFRGNTNFYCALKLFDPLLFSQKDRILLLDSDVLFFQKPTELMEHIERGQDCFNSDMADAYAPGAREYFEKRGLDILPKVNAGLMCIHKNMYVNNLGYIEEYFAYMDAIEADFDVNRHEQTLHAALLSQASAQRLGEEYQIAGETITEQTVSHHFVSDGESRNNLYLKGLKKLRNDKMLAL